MWTAVIVAGIGCYLLKLTGMSLPARLLEHPRAQRVAELMPVVLLAALIATQVFGSGSDLTVDARLAGLGFAVVAIALRAPFLVTVFGAALTAALLRLFF